jgi:hypothetical protein
MQRNKYKSNLSPGESDFTSPLIQSFAIYSFIWYLTDTFAITSGLFLAEMSIDRAIAVMYPMRVAQICTASRAVKVTVITASIQIIFNIQAFFSYKLPDPPNGALFRHVPEARWVEILLNLYQLIIGTILPFSILIVCNSVIIFRVRQAASERKKIESKERKTNETNLTVLLLMTSFAYLVCSIPKRLYEAVVGVLEYYDDLTDPYWSTRYWLQWWVCTQIWLLNFAINFYVYFLGGGAKFRRDTKEILFKICKNTSGIRRSK